MYAPPPKHISKVPLANMLLLNPGETLASLCQSQDRPQGHSYRVHEDPVRW